MATKGMAKDRRGSMEGQKVFIPDPNLSWARGSVTRTYGDGYRFEVRVEKMDARDGENCSSAQEGKDITVDLRHDAFTYQGIDSLPLQNTNLPPTGAEDMCTLSYLHEPAILYNLRARFLSHLPYTHTGEICIAVNPYQWLDIYGEALRAKYQRATNKAELPPHVYATSAVAYRGLRAYGKNQSILVSGESGAGKTETVKILLNHLASIAGSPNSDVTERVVVTHPLLEGFGNAKTIRNDNSSRFGKFTELQFCMVGKLIGSVINTYLLEKVRVVQHNLNERSYHVFYQMLAAPAKEKARFGLEGFDKTHFPYTSMGGDETSLIEGKTDSQRFAMTLNALELIGIAPQAIDDMFRALAGILYLGKLQFKAKNEGGHEGSEVTDPSLLRHPAEVLGIEEANLEKCLCHRTMTTIGEIFDVPLIPDKAAAGRDALAKEVYFRLFSWLVDRINESTASKGVGDARVGGTIGLLDIFGFESFAHNSFEQFCINFANEKLQQKFTQDVFKTVQIEYQQEGIPWSNIEFKDNAPVLLMIEAGHTGILAILNEECMLPKGSDEGFASKVAKTHGGHPNLISDKRASALVFTVKHYAGQVTYDSDGFVEKNKDTLQDDLVAMLAGSSNNLLTKIFIALPHGLDQTPPQKKGKGAMPAARHSRKGSLVQESVGSKFKRQLHALMVAVEQTTVQYVRCIKPNRNKSARELDNPMVVEQLRCAGVIEAIRISRAAYPNRLLFSDFVYRFQGLSMASEKINRGKGKQHNPNPNGTTLKAPSPQRHALENAEGCRAIIYKLITEADRDKLFAIGTTKVYFRSGVLEALEERRGLLLRSKVVKMQSVMLMFVARKRFLLWRRAAVVIEAAIRAFLGVLHYRRAKVAVLVAQCAWRQGLARRELARRREELRLKREREREEARRRAAEAEAARLRAEEEARVRALEEEAARRRREEEEAVKAKAEKADREKADRDRKEREREAAAAAAAAATAAALAAAAAKLAADQQALNGASYDDDGDDEGGDGGMEEEDDDFQFAEGELATGMAGLGMAGGDDDDDYDAKGMSGRHRRDETQNVEMRVQHERESINDVDVQEVEDEPERPASPRQRRRNSFLKFEPKVLVRSMEQGMRDFVHAPVPEEAGTVKCFIKRRKTAMSKLRVGTGGTAYTLYMESKNDVAEKFLLYAKRKEKKMGSSNYIITLQQEGDNPRVKDDEGCVGKLRACNGKRDEFIVYSGEADGDDARRELAAVYYSPDTGGTGGSDGGNYQDGPRRMMVALADPKCALPVGQRAPLLDRMKRGSLSDGNVKLVNRNPRWNNNVGAYVLNFHGRVTQASVKNFQLVRAEDEDEKIILQFGKTHTDEFTMDFTAPLSPLQAFAITLTSFDCK